MSELNITTSIKGGVMTMMMLIMIVCGIGAFWYWAGYVHTTLQELVVLIQGDSVAAQQQKLRAMRKEVRDTAQSRLALHQLAITEEQVPSFLNELEALGSERVPVFVRGVDIQGDKGAVSISLAFSGSFDEVLSIVKSVSSTGYSSYIDSFEVRTGKRILGGGEVQDASMRLMVPLLMLQLEVEEE